ncbi:hypothetical protein ACU4GR_09985 (plasmid) [Methylobacterium oryzae CBMB20]
MPIRRRLDRSGAWISETEALVAAVSRVVDVEADAEIVRVDDTLSECRLLSDGWTCRHTPLKAARPQILALQLPGEFLDLHGLLERRVDHVNATLTPCRIGLTSIHASRTVRRLRQAGLVSWRGRWMTIEDWAGHRRIAEFDPAHLSLEHASP